MGNAGSALRFEQGAERNLDGQGYAQRRFETEGMEAVARDYGSGPTRVQLQNKDSRGFVEFNQQLAERDFRMAKFYDDTKHYRSAKFYYAQLIRDYPDTPLAAKSQERYAALGGSPDLKNLQISSSRGTYPAYLPDGTMPFDPYTSAP